MRRLITSLLGAVALALGLARPARADYWYYQPVVIGGQLYYQPYYVYQPPVVYYYPYYGYQPYLPLLPPYYGYPIYR